MLKITADKNNKRHTEPALIGQENVHIAEKISEIRPEYSGRHKGEIPAMAGKIVFTGSTGK